MTAATLPSIMDEGSTRFHTRHETLPEPPSKRCASCGETFFRHPMELRRDYAARRTCCRSCEEELRAQPKPAYVRLVKSQNARPERICPVCGEAFIPHPNENLSRFMERKTCGSRCGATLRWREGRDRVRLPEPTDEEIDRRAAIILARMAKQRAA